MRDIWFSDSRDIVKWGTMVHIADRLRGNDPILIQLPFLRAEQPMEYRLRRLAGDDAENSTVFPPGVLSAFSRKTEGIYEKQSQLGFAVKAFLRRFEQERSGDSEYRNRYINEFINWMKETARGRVAIVLVDPDTGLESGNGGPAYVKARELRSLYNALPDGSWLVLYQHAPRKENWISDARAKIAIALKVQVENLEVFDCREIAADVAFFTIGRSPGTST